LLSWSSLTLVRAGIWGSMPLLMQHMYTVHPDSKRLIIIYANNYADSGDYPQALRLLGRYDDPGFRLNRLYIGCLRDGRIADNELRLMTAAMQGVVNDHAMTGLIRMANLGLDGKCEFSAQLFLDLMDRAASARIQSTQLQKLHLYRAHYLYRQEGLEAALPALEAAFRAVNDNPVPLFLATEWLLDAGQDERARGFYARALQVVQDSRYDYSTFTGSIGRRLENMAE
jgi:tetratricopeptide (TPR) repeat protein